MALVTYPSSTVPQTQTLLADDSVQSHKWAAYIALRGVPALAIRNDLDPAAQLPAIVLEDRRVIPARDIPSWVDTVLQSDPKAFEPPVGSRAWVALLLGPIHDAVSGPRLPKRSFALPAFRPKQGFEDALDAISHRLGDDKWFLGSPHPTSIDALLYAYLHVLARGPTSLQFHLNKRQNLLSFENSVFQIVQSVFRPSSVTRRSSS